DQLAVHVVDDQEEARVLIGETLGDYGAHVQLFASGEEVLDALSWQAIDKWPAVLICDISLGETDGYQVIGKLRNIEESQHIPLGRRLPAIALSGHSAAEDRLHALLAGFQVYMAKPVDP